MENAHLPAEIYPLISEQGDVETYRNLRSLSRDMSQIIYQKRSPPKIIDLTDREMYRKLGIESGTTLKYPISSDGDLIIKISDNGVLISKLVLHPFDTTKNRYTLGIRPYDLAMWSKGPDVSRYIFYTDNIKYFHEVSHFRNEFIVNMPIEEMCYPFVWNELGFKPIFMGGWKSNDVTVAKVAMVRSLVNTEQYYTVTDDQLTQVYNPVQLEWLEDDQMFDDNNDGTKVLWEGRITLCENVYKVYYLPNRFFGDMDDIRKLHPGDFDTYETFASSLSYHINKYNFGGDAIWIDINF